jgi:hypothetical protein
MAYTMTDTGAISSNDHRRNADEILMQIGISTIILEFQGLTRQAKQIL